MIPKQLSKKAAEEYANDVCEGSHHRCGLKQYCMVDFMEGYLSGWDACLKHLGEIPWDEAMDEVVNHITDNRPEIPNSSKKEEDNE